MHTISNERLFDGVVLDHLMKSVIEPKKSLWASLKFQFIIKAILENEGILRSHGVVGLTWVPFHIQEILNYVNRLTSLSNHEQHRAHESYLMPKERIPYIMKVEHI